MTPTTTREHEARCPGCVSARRIGQVRCMACTLRAQIANGYIATMKGPTT